MCVYEIVLFIAGKYHYNLLLFLYIDGYVYCLFCFLLSFSCQIILIGFIFSSRIGQHFIPSNRICVPLPSHCYEYSHCEHPQTVLFVDMHTRFGGGVPKSGIALS